MFNETKQRVFSMLLSRGMPAEAAGFEINRCFARFALSKEARMQFKIGPVNFVMIRNEKIDVTIH